MAFRAISHWTRTAYQLVRNLVASCRRCRRPAFSLGFPIARDQSLVQHLRAQCLVVRQVEAGLLLSLHLQDVSRNRN